MIYLLQFQFQFRFPFKSQSLLNQLLKHFERLPRERENALPTLSQRILLETVTRLRLIDPRELNTLSGGWHDSETATVISATKRDLPRLSDAIAVSYFAHSAISRTEQGVPP